MKRKYLFRIVVIMSATFSISSCEKLVEIPAPTNTIVTEQVYADDINATSAVLGIYSKMLLKNSPASFSNGWITTFCGMMADELAPNSPDPNGNEFYRNELRPVNTYLSALWVQAYSIIYQTNATLESLKISTGVSDEVKRRLTGEVLFLRAFCYYYLTQLYGDVPYITATDWRVNENKKRESKDDIIKSCLVDLHIAKDLVTGSFNDFNNERVRVTKWACYFLIARMSLVVGDFGAAESFASIVISNNVMFKLEGDLNAVFSSNSIETVLQLQNSSATYPFNALPEGVFLPYSRNELPIFKVTDSLVSSFDTADSRFKSWMSYSTVGGQKYYFAYKYKIGPAQARVNGPVSEYYTLFRLGELYLIRAEARLKLGSIDEAFEDINMIRFRSGLAKRDTSEKSLVLKYLIDERRHELCFEWGNRWFDLRRLGVLDEIMSKAALWKRGTWAEYRKYIPISASEINTNPAIVQNPGYY